MITILILAILVVGFYRHISPYWLLLLAIGFDACSMHRLGTTPIFFSAVCVYESLIRTKHIPSKLRLPGVIALMGLYLLLQYYAT